MGKNANPGELRTPVRFAGIRRTTDAEGYPIEQEYDVFQRPVMVKWVNAHGTDVYSDLMSQAVDPATITCRWSPHIKTDLLVYKENDPDPYEIVGPVDDVGDRHAWIELQVRRKVPAK